MKISALLALGILLLGLAAPTASAQEGPADEDLSDGAAESPMVIEFLNGYDAQVPDELQRESTRIFSNTFGRLTVYADGVACGTIRFQPDDGVNLPRLAVVATFAVGLPTQPEACQREGARIHFVNGYPSDLVTDTTLRQGATVQILNLAPFPPNAGAPADAGAPSLLPSGGTGGLAQSADDARVPLAILAGLFAATGVLVLSRSVYCARRANRLGE